ncbi:MAG: hypothetical protein M1814_005914 [Vezdaea aestivalis]|nr:MAG: hypothetical protein M1814_005914 [Vezdaea aestivalis]
MNSGATLDRLLDSPIGLALRCSGGPRSARKNCFKNKDKAEELFETWHLDLWATSSGERVLCDSKAVDTGRENWIGELDGVSGPLGRDGELRFRVLLMRPPKDEKYPWPRFHDRSPPGQKQVYFVPFFRKDVANLILKWSLPQDWLYLRLNSKGCGNFSRQTIWNSKVATPELISNPEMVQKSKGNLDEEMRNGDHFIWSLALSHHLVGGTTNALFDGFTERMTEDLSERLGAASCFWSEHPLYFPIALLDNMKEIGGAYFALDSARMIEFGSITLFGRNLADLVEGEMMLQFNLKLAGFLLETIAYLEESGIVEGPSNYNETPLFSLTYSELIKGIRLTYIKFIYLIGELQKRNTNALGMLHANLSRVENLYSKERADDSRALAYESKQDSASMITISILTIAFLPTTAVAAICSTSVVDWSRPDRVVVSPHFWIFWAIVIPLTLTLMTGWFAWYFLYRRPKMEYTRRSMECMSCSDKRIYGSGQPCPEHRETFSALKYWTENLPFYIKMKRAKEPSLTKA